MPATRYHLANSDLNLDFELLERTQTVNFELSSLSDGILHTWNYNASAVYNLGVTTLVTWIQNLKDYVNHILEDFFSSPPDDDDVDISALIRKALSEFAIVNDRIA